MYHSLYKSVIAALLTSLIFAGCIKDDLFSDKTSEEVSTGAIGFNTTENTLTKGMAGSDWLAMDVPLSGGVQANASSENPSSVTSAASDFSCTSSLLTRGAPVLGTEAPAGSFGVLGYLLTGGTWNSATATPSFMYDTQVTRTGTSGSYSLRYYPIKYWPENTADKVRFFAYYPYRGEGISLSSATTAGYPVITYTPTTTVSSQVDLMYAAPAAVNNKTTGTAVNFAFSHALTRISFSAKLGATFTTQTVLIQSIQITGLKSSGTLSLDPALSNPWTIGSTTTSYTASTSDASIVPATSQTLSKNGYLYVTTPSGYLLLLPQSVTTSNTVVVNYTIDGAAKTATFQLAAATWTKGQSINYQLTIPGPTATGPTANCYIVAPNSSITISVNVKGNGDATLASLIGGSITIAPASVGLLWQTSSPNLSSTDVIKSIGSVSGGCVTIETGSASGNAVIAAYDAAGTTILWSWHIWVTSYNPKTGTTYSYTSTSGVTNVFMDRNLGAISVAPADVNTLGLLYQWGRKDPFTGASAYASGTTTFLPSYGTHPVATSDGAVPIATTIMTPYVCNYSDGNDWNSTPNNFLWGGASVGVSKSIFDPCPAGWRVPSFYKTSTSASPWIGLATYQASSYWSTNGYQWTASPPGIGFWPAAGYRHDYSGVLYSVGSEGYYWSASPGSSYGYFLYFFSGIVSSSIFYGRANGFSVRCVQEW